jgi:hypothetical protein
MDAIMSGGEASSNEGATTSAGGIETTIAIEVNAHQHPEDTKSLVVAEGDVPQPMEVVVHAEASKA